MVGYTVPDSSAYVNPRSDSRMLVYLSRAHVTQLHARLIAISAEQKWQEEDSTRFGTAFFVDRRTCFCWNYASRSVCLVYLIAVVRLDICRVLEKEKSTSTRAEYQSVPKHDDSLFWMLTSKRHLCFGSQWYTYRQHELLPFLRCSGKESAADSRSTHETPVTSYDNFIDAKMSRLNRAPRQKKRPV